MASKDNIPFLFYESCPDIPRPKDYKPYIVIDHNYPTIEIATIAQENDKKVREINNEISRLRRQINNQLNTLIEKDKIDVQPLDTNGVLETLLSSDNYRLKKNAVLANKIANIGIDSIDSNTVEKIRNFIIDLPTERDRLRQLVNNENYDYSIICKNRDLRNSIQTRDKFVFTGLLSKKNRVVVNGILETISNERIYPPDGSDEYNLLVEEFGENFKKDFGKIDFSLYTCLHFLPYYIFPHSTVYYVQRLIELLIGVPVDYQYLWGYSQVANNKELSDFYFERIYRNLYDRVSRGVLKTSVSAFFEMLGYSPEKIHELYSNNTTLSSLECFTKEHLMYEKPLNSIFMSYFEYHCLNFFIIYDRKNRVGHFPNINPFFALLDKFSAERYISMLDEPNKIAVGNTNQNRTLSSFDNIERNEINFVSLYNFSRYMNTYVPIDEKPTFIDSVGKRYFYAINDLDIFVNPLVFELDDNNRNLLRNLDNNQKLFHFFLKSKSLIPDNLNFEINAVNITESRFHIESSFRTFGLETLNLRDIMNQFRLSDQIPFIRLFDEQRDENIYRIYRESFIKDTVDKINKTTLESWFNTENVTVTLQKLTKIYEPKRCLTIKMRLCNQIESYIDPMKIEYMDEIYDETLPIKKYIVNYQNGTIEHNIEEYLLTPDKTAVYKHKLIYMDVYIMGSNGTIRFKSVFNPDLYYHMAYMIMTEHTMNTFLEKIKDFPEANKLKLINLCKLLNHQSDNYLSFPLNNNSIIEYKYNASFFITYENFKRIVSIFIPYFTIIEPLIKLDTPVQFLIKGVYQDVVIEQIHLDGKYDLRYKDRVIRGIPAQNLKIKSENIKSNYINFRYKRVSNYKKNDPIVEIYQRYKSWGLSNDQIRDRIQKEFDISESELSEMEKQLTNAVKDNKGIDDNKLDINGIDIKLFFELPEEKDSRSYKIEIEYYKNIYDYGMIVELLNSMFHLYYVIFVGKDSKVLSDFSLDIKELDNIEISAKQNLDEELEQQQNEQDADFDFDYDDFMNEQLHEEEKEEALEVVNDSLKTEEIIVENVTEFDYDMIANSTNLILKLLYESDRNQFIWSSKDKKKRYSIACQTTKRYPKVLQDNTFTKDVLDEAIAVEPVEDSIPVENLPFSAGLGLTYLGNKKGIVEDIKVGEEYCFPGEKVESGKKCVSILYGSQEDQNTWQNVFMCPKIWCLVDRIPLHPRHLIEGKCVKTNCDRFVSSADVLETDIKNWKKFEKEEFINWRICKNCQEDILEHTIKCPRCKRGVLDASNHNNIPTKTTSLYVIPKESNYIYPGFINNSKHPNNIYSMCCFDNPNSRVSDIKAYNVLERKQQYNISGKYIQTFGKNLDRGRYGQLPKSFAGFFNLPANYFNETILSEFKDKNERFYRFGVDIGHNNVLDCLRAVVLNNEQYKKGISLLEDQIAREITPEILRMTPLLDYAMRDFTNRGISSLQNYIEYVLSDNYKYDFTLFQFLNRNMDWMRLGNNTDIPLDDIERGINIFFITFNENGQVIVELPKGYIQPYQIGEHVNSKCLILFKKPGGVNLSGEAVCNKGNTNLDIFEPIFAVKKDEIPNVDNIVKFFDMTHPIIIKIMSILDTRKDQIIKIPTKIYGSQNKFPNYTYEWLLNIQPISNVIIDTSGYIIAGILEDNTYIPLYPTSYDSRTNKSTIAQVLYFESSLLQSYEECLININKYIQNEELSWLKPIKIIMGKDGFIGFMTIVGAIIPFRPIVNINDNVLPVMNLDFRDIENKIVSHKHRNPVSKKMSFKEIIGLNYSKNQYRVSLNPNGEIDYIYLLGIDTDTEYIKIPIDPIKYDIHIHGQPISKRYKDYSFTNAIKIYNKLYQQTLGKMRCRPVAVRMDIENKLIKSIFLETGDEIKVRPDTIIYRRDDENKLLIHRIGFFDRSNYTDMLSGYDWSKYDMEAADGDKRVHYIQTINYDRNSYSRFRFEVAQILASQKPKVEKIENSRIIHETDKKRIQNILKEPQSNNYKRAEILKIIIDVVSRYMTIDVISDEIKKQETRIDILESCINHNSRNECVSDPYCRWKPNERMTREEWININKPKPLTDIEISGYLDDNGEVLSENRENNINMYWGLRYDNRGLDEYIRKYEAPDSRFKKNVDVILKKNGFSISDISSQNIRAYIKMKERGECRLLVNKDSDEIGNMKFVRRIVEEIVRNNIKRGEILNNKIRLVETRLSYHIYTGERFFTTSDVKSKLYDDIYCKELRNRLKILNYFTRNSSLYEFVVPEIMYSGFIERIREFKLLNRLDLNVSFKVEPEELFIVPEIGREHLVRILDHNETQRALHSIMVLNTPLDTYRIGETSIGIDFTID